MSNPYPKLKVRMKRKSVYSWVLRNNTNVKELGMKLGLSPSYFSQMLHGRRYPNGEKRRQILKVMKPLTWDDLFSEDYE